MRKHSTAGTAARLDTSERVANLFTRQGIYPPFRQVAGRVSVAATDYSTSGWCLSGPVLPRLDATLGRPAYAVELSQPQLG